MTGAATTVEAEVIARTALYGTWSLRAAVAASAAVAGGWRSRAETGCGSSDREGEDWMLWKEDRKKKEVQSSLSDGEKSKSGFRLTFDIFLRDCPLLFPCASPSLDDCMETATSGRKRTRGGIESEGRGS